MPQLFQRAVRILIGTTVIENLRVQLKVKHTSKKEPNTCELSITNLAAQSRAALQSKGTPLQIEAGYVGTIAQIFSGTSRWVDHIHDGANWVTRVEAGDGEVPYAKALTGSFRKGTPVATVFQQLAAQTGLDVRDATNTVRRVITEQFTKGYTAHGKTSVEFDALLNGRGLVWSMQDGKLQVLEAGATTTESIIVLSPSTGLVGSPAHGSPDTQSGTPAMLTIKSLLQPSLRPGRKVRVESESVNGDFRVVNVTHAGDTAGGNWHSDVEVLPL